MDIEDIFYLYLAITRPAILSFYLQSRRNLRSVWSRQIFLDRERNDDGAGSSLLPDLYNNHPELFFNYTRMSRQKFMELLSAIGPRLKKKTTTFRKPIPPAIRLAICLRFLATGTSYPELSYTFRISKPAVCNIINETTRQIVFVLKEKYLKLPSTHAQWEDVEAGFDLKWHFPHCVGAIDGKHIAIQAPPASGSSFINYKGFHSIVLMAACDAQYCFTFVDIGNYGRVSDGGVFAETYLANKLLNDPNFLPPDSLLKNSNKTAPYVFVGDEAFPLQKHLLRPFPGHFLEKRKRVYNYRLSRARRCIENAFGILVARWRVLLTTMALSPDNATWVTMACCCLHNFLMKTEMPYANRSYCPISFSDRPTENGLIDGDARSQNQLTPLISLQENNSSADDIRNIFASYLNNEGAVSFQDNV